MTSARSISPAKASIDFSRMTEGRSGQVDQIAVVNRQRRQIVVVRGFASEGGLARGSGGLARHIRGLAEKI